jgi:hypothetical protein
LTLTEVYFEAGQRGLGCWLLFICFELVDHSGIKLPNSILSAVMDFKFRLGSHCVLGFNSSADVLLHLDDIIFLEC